MVVGDVLMDDAEQHSSRPDGSLTRHTVAGVKWSYFASLTGGVLQLGTTAVMARLLTPAAFGLVALAGVALRFVDHFAKAGVTQALIQKTKLSSDDIRAGVALSVGLGFLFGLVAFLAAPIVSRIAQDPELVPVLRWLSLTLLLNGLHSPSTALLRRSLRFKQIALIEIGSYVIGYMIVGLALALSGAGVFALVGAIISQMVVKVAASYAVTRHPLLPTRSMRSYRSVLGFGGRVSIIGFFEFLQSNLDTVALGRWEGSTRLGLYNRAKMIGELPSIHLTFGLQRVLFPSFSAIQLERSRLRAVYLSTIGIASSIIIPLNVGMAVAARELVLVLLGPQWVDAVEVLPWLLLAASVTLLGMFAGTVAEAQAALNQKLVVAVTSTIVLSLLLAISAGRSLASYGMAVAASAIVSHLGYLRILTRTLDTSAGSLLRPYSRSLLGGLVVGVAVAICRRLLLLVSASVGIMLLGQILTGAITLVLLLRFGPLSAFRADLVSRLMNAGMLPVALGARGRMVRRLVGPPA